MAHFAFIFGALACVSGFFIPFVARRFGKFLPADAGTALVRCFHFSKKVASKNAKRIAERRGLRLKLHAGALGYAASGAGCALFLLHFGFSPVFLLMFWLCALLANIDERLCVLPDVLTVPLILTGFAAAASGLSGVAAFDSAAGALAGFLLPTLASAIMSALRPRSLGGGDYKMLAGIGAWLGFAGVASVILLSFFWFALIMLKRGVKEGPYGSALLLSVLTFFVWQASGCFPSFLFVVG